MRYSSLILGCRILIVVLTLQVTVWACSHGCIELNNWLVSYDPGGEDVCGKYSPKQAKETWTSGLLDGDYSELTGLDCTYWGCLSGAPECGGLYPQRSALPCSDCGDPSTIGKDRCVVNDP